MTEAWISEHGTEGLVSVVIPTYDRRQLLAETMDSVFGQSYRPIELIVVDDGGTDDTDVMVGERSSRWSGDPGFEVRYVHQPNAGTQAARNRGARLANGQFIRALDSDDLLYPENIERSVRALQKTGADMACGPGQRFARVGGVPYDLGRVNTGRPPAGLSPLSIMLRGRNLLQPNLSVMTRRLVAKVGPWDEMLHQFEDIDFGFRAALLGASYAYAPLALTGRRQHSGERTSRRRGPEFAESHRCLVAMLDQSLQASGRLMTYRADLCCFYCLRITRARNWESHLFDAWQRRARELWPPSHPIGWPGFGPCWRLIGPVRTRLVRKAFVAARRARTALPAAW